jgi:hypothetical protein
MNTRVSVRSAVTAVTRHRDKRCGGRSETLKSKCVTVAGATPGGLSPAESDDVSGDWVASMRLGTALFVLLLAWADSAGAAQPRSRILNLRGIPLGMTMAQFRSMPFPDHDSFPAARPFCSNDPGVSKYESLQVEATMLQAGIVKCGYFSPEKSPDTGEEKLVAAQLDVFGEAVTPLFLFYQTDGSDDFRMAQITFGMPNQNASALIGLFQRAYGAPTSFDVSVIDMDFGLQLANISYLWATDRVNIKVDTISFVLNQMSVVFIDNHLWGDLHDRLQSIDNVNRLIAGDQKRRRGAEDKGAEDRGTTTLEGDAPGDDSNDRPGLLPGLSEPDADPGSNADAGSDGDTP